MPDPSTEEILADARRLYASLVDASTRLATFTELLRMMLRALPPDENEENADDQPE